MIPFVAVSVRCPVLGDRVDRVLIVVVDGQTIRKWTSERTPATIQHTRPDRLSVNKVASRQWVSLKAMVALNFMYYNFGRVHQTLRVTPAMEAGIADHLWSIEEVVGLLG